MIDTLIKYLTFVAFRVLRDPKRPSNDEQKSGLDVIN
jgi:hypothetical protein